MNKFEAMRNYYSYLSDRVGVRRAQGSDQCVISGEQPSRSDNFHRHGAEGHVDGCAPLGIGVPRVGVLHIPFEVLHLDFTHPVKCHLVYGTVVFEQLVEVRCRDGVRLNPAGADHHHSLNATSPYLVTKNEATGTHDQPID